MNTAVRSNDNVTAVSVVGIKASEWTPAHSLAVVSGQTLPIDAGYHRPRFTLELPEDLLAASLQEFAEITGNPSDQVPQTAVFKDYYGWMLAAHGRSRLPSHTAVTAMLELHGVVQVRTREGYALSGIRLRG